MRIVIIGAGGHAQVVADALQCMSQAGSPIELAGYLDDAPHLQDRTFLGVPVLGPVSKLSGIPHEAIVVAIGDNRTRSRIYEVLKVEGEHFVTIRHPASIIAGDVEIGPGCMVCAGVILNTGTVVGENVILNTGCTIDHHNRIGNHAHVAPGCHTGGEVEIGEGALVGLGASVMPRCRIGSWSTIGAGALVHRNLPDSITAVGVPAKLLEPPRPERS